MRVRKGVLILGAGIAASLVATTFVQACSSSCDTCEDGGGPLDGAKPDDASQQDGGVNACACPAADAALFNPSGTSCCAGSSCVSQHDDGFDASFYDCYGTGSWAVGLAMDACHTYFDASVSCVAATCNLSQVVEGLGPKCVTWAYYGSDTEAIGHVSISGDAGCTCPDAGARAWY
jgi:hypothetical protein